MEKAIQDAVDLTEKYEKNLNALLASPKYNGNLLVINAQIRLIKNKLAFAGGILGGIARKTVSIPGRKHKPFTSFMGHPIEVKQPETSSEVKRSLSPSQAEKDLYRKRVAKLMGEISNFPPQSIITNYRRPEDVMIVRGVAYKLGLEDADKREFNIEFITDIIEAINKKREEGTLQDLIDKAAAEDKDATKKASILKLNVDKERAEKLANIRSKILTAEDIAEDDWLKKKGAQPGDKLTWDANRHKKIIPAKKDGAPKAAENAQDPK